jgi:hypothetical protein
VVGESCERRSLKKSRESDSEESQKPYSKENITQMKGLGGRPAPPEAVKGLLFKNLE